MDKRPQEKTNSELLRSIPDKSNECWQLPPKKTEETRMDHERREVNKYDAP